VGFWLSSCTYIHHIISFVQTTSYQQTSLFTRLQVTHVIPVHRNTETTWAHCFSHCGDQSIVQFQKAAVAIREGEVQRHEAERSPLLDASKLYTFGHVIHAQPVTGHFDTTNSTAFPLPHAFSLTAPLSVLTLPLDIPQRSLVSHYLRYPLQSPCVHLHLSLLGQVLDYYSTMVKRQQVS